MSRRIRYDVPAGDRKDLVDISKAKNLGPTRRTNMNLFCIKRTEEIDYDEFAGFVIAAETEARAREIAAGRSSGEGKGIWLRTFDGNYYTQISQIELLASDVSLPEGVVLEDYRAG